MVGVELFCVRYLWDDAEYLWLTQRAPDEDRFLSCNLNLSWPDQGVVQSAELLSEQAAILATLHDVYDQMIISTRVVASRSARGRSLCRLADIFQFRPCVEIRQHAASTAPSPRNGFAAVVARPIHPPRLAVN